MRPRAAQPAATPGRRAALSAAPSSRPSAGCGPIRPFSIFDFQFSIYPRLFSLFGSAEYTSSRQNQVFVLLLRMTFAIFAAPNFSICDDTPNFSASWRSQPPALPPGVRRPRRSPRWGAAAISSASAAGATPGTSSWLPARPSRPTIGPSASRSTSIWQLAPSNWATATPRRCCATSRCAIPARSTPTTCASRWAPTTARRAT